MYCTCDDVRGPSQILEQQVFIGPLRVRFDDRSRSRAVHDDRDAVLAIQTRIGIQRHTNCGDVDAENALAMPLNRRDELFVSRQRMQCLRQQQAFYIDADAVKSHRRLHDQPTNTGFDCGGILFRRHPTVELQREPIGNDVRIDTAVQQPYIIVG